MIKKWPGSSFAFHAWLRLNATSRAKQRRQLYSFYTDAGTGFEAFFSHDLSCLIICVCTKKEFLSMQLNTSDLIRTDSSTNWHSFFIMYIPAKNPFSSSQLCVYIDGKLKRECDLKMPQLNDTFKRISICGALTSGYDKSQRQQQQQQQQQHKKLTSYMNTVTSSFASPIAINLKNVFTKNNVNEKQLYITSVVNGTQDMIWDTSSCLYGHLSSCIVLHDILNQIQIKMLHQLGPNFYGVCNNEIAELVDIKSKIVFYYDAKCCKDNICTDLSMHGLHGEFGGERYRLNTFKVFFDPFCYKFSGCLTI
jgi:hypothetical protein